MCASISASSRRSAPGCMRMRAMVPRQWRCWETPVTRGTRGGGVEAGVVPQGTGGSTSSCTLRSDEVGSAAR